MSPISPKSVIIHCGLHKTGSTYLQKNLNFNKSYLARHGILYIGPKTLKQDLRPLWNHVQWGLNEKMASRKAAQKVEKSLQRKTPAKREISTILISFESIFGTLRGGLVEKDRPRCINGESELGLYRYAKNRTDRLMSSLEYLFDTDDIWWRMVTVNRKPESFARSCYAQLIKEGHNLSKQPVESFIEHFDFTFTTNTALQANLQPLSEKRNVEHSSLSYEANIDKTDPSIYLWSFLKLSLTNVQSIDYEKMIENFRTGKINRHSNPSLSERGLKLAMEARPLFKPEEWKPFRKFLEQNYPKGK
ncbi:MAG: hypothetical protein CL862_05760 [Cyanobium sp. NAT70]|nr:hypothetical protein [Cyanobium sp. NAT70]|tara:strand:- start:164 stop:1075 length:912 start_codon:yes stop_codon:yes gene_type:complete